MFFKKKIKGKFSTVNSVIPLSGNYVAITSSSGGAIFHFQESKYSVIKEFSGNVVFSPSFEFKEKEYVGVAQGKEIFILNLGTFESEVQYKIEKSEEHGNIEKVKFLFLKNLFLFFFFH